MSAKAEFALVVAGIRGRYVSREAAQKIASVLVDLRREYGADKTGLSKCLTGIAPMGRWDTELRRPITRFLCADFEGLPAVSYYAAGIFMGVSTSTVRSDVIGYQPRKQRPAVAGRQASLGTALKQARPTAAIDNRPAEKKPSPAGIDIASSLRPALVAIGQSDDPRRYAGLVSEIGRVLTE